jgi:septal ring factor EnvC (AmiA/AmiB activator)
VSLAEEANIMASHEFDETPHHEPSTSSSNGSKGAVIGLTIGLVVALAGDGYLLKRTNDTNQQMAQMQTDTQGQITKLGDATTDLLQQRLKALDDEMTAAMKGASTTTSAALKRTQADALKQSQELSKQIQEQQQQVASQIGDLKEATNSVDSKVSAVSSDVGNVKTDVTTVKADIATTQSNLDKTTADLKRMNGDMGVMSGLIATNGKDLAALRELGERNYFEFDINKKQADQRIGNVTLRLKAADPKRNRFTLEVLADDKRVEKKDRTINEPVQVYVSGSRQPYEIVVNQVKKDDVVGYLSTPKVTLARK